MYIQSWILLLWSYVLYVNCNIPLCCPGENILIVENSTCKDGSNFTFGFCETVSSVGYKQEQGTLYRINAQDETLMVTSQQEKEYLQFDPDKYCLTKNSLTNGEIVVLCSEYKQSINLSTKGTILLSIKAICSVITLLFLIPVLIIYFVIPDLRDVEGNCVINFVLFICIAHLVIICVPVANHFESHACKTMSFIYWISYITSYNWLAVLSFHIWRITIKPVFLPHIRWFVFYCCYGYGIPLIIMATALAMYYTSDIKLQETRDFHCLIDGSPIVWSYFCGSTMVISLVAITFQFFVAKRLWMGNGKNDQTPPAIRLRNKSLVCLHLLLIMVTIKIVDIICYAYFYNHGYLDYLWEFSDCRSILIGGVIFFILIVQRRKVMKSLAKHGLWCIKFPESWKSLVDEENDRRQSIAIQNNSPL